MEDPIKIIWKLKNKNKKIHYHVYVFIGDILHKNTMDILDKIKKISLLDALLNLTDKEHEHIVKEYGEYWYEKFYISHHITNIKMLLNSNKLRKQEIINKMGESWFDKHIKNWIPVKKIIHAYATLIKEERERKIVRKARGKEIEIEPDVDYRTGIRAISEKKKQSTGDMDIEQSRVINLSSDYLNESDSESDDEDNRKSVLSYKYLGEQKGGTLLEELEDTSKPIHDDSGEQSDSINGDIEYGSFMDANEVADDAQIENIYETKDVEEDKHIKETSSLIKEIMNEDKLVKKKYLIPGEFDVSKDENMYDDILKDVYTKTYITSNYIFKDDTIKTIKSKICVSIKQDPSIDISSFIPPSRQYLWSEYTFENNLEKVMIGQKWIKKNDLLQIDIEPNTNIRTYEKLRGNLKLLKDNIRKMYGDKIKRDDDDNIILYDYDDYMTNNEIFMIDLYHELGKDYDINQDDMKNLYDVYIRIYFPKIKMEDMDHIIDYLNNKQKIEKQRIDHITELITNDLFIENEVTRYVENVKKNESGKYNNIFKENYITQSVIHVHLKNLAANNVSIKRLDLRRIYDNFITTTDFPFLQYQTLETLPQYKFHTPSILANSKDGLEAIYKWFENTQYGVSFKFKINEVTQSGETIKYMTINLNDNGRVEYKTQWKEDDRATIDNIKNSYSYVKMLLSKINDENTQSGIKLGVLDDSDFKYAFMNTIQKFVLPKNTIINHNDLSEFSRFFFPYVTVVIVPRKRQARTKKLESKSKYGTYLRYRRVSKYESSARIEHRIIYFMRNYEYTDRTLADEMSKQFNITEQKAMEEIKRVKEKYPLVKRARKILKKLEDIPKYKPPGVGIDIQGKIEDKYKMRIAGARSQEQLNRIIMFMNILIYLYIDTYLNKKPERQELKERLKKLTSVARRRNKVEELVKYGKEVKMIKQMTMFDKQRIKYKVEKGQSQWTRTCQNSGDETKRRPQLLTSVEELTKQGYTYNKHSGFYERKVIIKKLNGKRLELILKAVKLPEINEQGLVTGNYVYYTAGPEENGEHMYIGFLTKGNNPLGLCMPCGFKKDQMTSKNKEKQDHFFKCIKSERGEMGKKIVGDKLYVLQDTDKIQEGRLGTLPKYLDIFFNIMLKKEKKVKNHYLTRTLTGYFFKYGSRQEEYPFMNAVGAVYDLDVDHIKNKIIDAINNDKSDQIFTSLNNGDIKTRFGNRIKYVDFINASLFTDHEFIVDILRIPNVLTKDGINLIIFQKNIYIIKKILEKEKRREDYVPLCQNTENTDDLLDPNKDNVIMIKEGTHYYPIIMVTKTDDILKNMHMTKIFKYVNSSDNIINHLYNYYKLNCQLLSSDELLGTKQSFTAKNTCNILDKLHKDFHAKYQIIDKRNKCRYVITSSSLIIPTRASGSIWNLQIRNDYSKWLKSYHETHMNLIALWKLAPTLPINPIGVYYDEKDNSLINVVAIITSVNDYVPIIPEKMDKVIIKKDQLLKEYKPLYEKIDKEIEKGRSNIIIDDRILSVSKNSFDTESYELFRYEVSEYLDENKDVREKIINIINNNKYDKNTKRIMMRLILYKLIDSNLYDIYKNLSIRLLNTQNTHYPSVDKHDDKQSTSEDSSEDSSEESEEVQRQRISETDSELSETKNILDGGALKSIMTIRTKPITDKEYSQYVINNNRELCSVNTSSSKCSSILHCGWNQGKCKFMSDRESMIKFINKITDELTSDNKLKAWEILKHNNFFVSNVVDYNVFIERENQTIVRSTHINIKKKFGDLFGQDNLPKIGKRKGMPDIDVEYQQKNIDNPMHDLGDFYIQNIVANNNTLFRAYANSMYWIKYHYYENTHRNIGYYSPYQTELANAFKSQVITWLLDKKNNSDINDNLMNIIAGSINKKTNVLREYVIRCSSEVYMTSTGYVELYVLSRIHNVPIYVYDNNNNLIYLFSNGEIDINKIEPIYTELRTKQNSVNIKFNYIVGNTIPDEIEVIYFK
jgi:hypothetical protein